MTTHWSAHNERVEQNSASRESFPSKRTTYNEPRTPSLFTCESTLGMTLSCSILSLEWCVRVHMSAKGGVSNQVTNLEFLVPLVCRHCVLHKTDEFVRRTLLESRRGAHRARRPQHSSAPGICENAFLLLYLIFLLFHTSSNHFPLIT
jgi:hypothetical protein